MEQPQAEQPLETTPVIPGQPPIQEEAIEKKDWKRHISRRNAVIAGAVILVLAAATVVGWRSRRMGYTKQFSIEGWHVISNQSDDVIGLTKSEASLDKSSSLAVSLRKLDSAVKDQKVSLTLIPQFLNDDRILVAYGSFITDMGAFTTQVAAMGDDPSAISADDLDQAKSLAKAAAIKTGETKEKLGYLTESINPKVFEVVAYLESLKKLSDEAKAKAATEAKTKKQQAEQDALDKQLVELSITSFMDGYISGDAAKMKRYMTDAFIAEYNFNNLSSEQRKYVYPSSYRIVTTTKQDGGNYSVQVNIINKYRNTDTPTTDQYTVSMTYTVIYNTKSGRWLINVEKAN